MIREAVAENRTVELTVTGSSMLPLLLDHVSSVRLEKPGELKKGDMVLFLRSDGRYVLHRISVVRNGVYDILGDNLPNPDRDVPQEDILAKVAAYNRRGKVWRTDDRLYRVLLPAVRVIRFCGHRIKQKLFSQKTEK